MNFGFPQTHLLNNTTMCVCVRGVGRVAQNAIAKTPQRLATEQTNERTNKQESERNEQTYFTCTSETIRETVSK